MFTYKTINCIIIIDIQYLTLIYIIIIGTIPTLIYDLVVITINYLLINYKLLLNNHLHYESIAK